MKAKDILWGICSVAILATAWGIRLTHSHMTETELFVNFWYVWLILAGLVASMYYLTAERKKQ